MGGEGFPCCPFLTLSEGNGGGMGKEFGRLRMDSGQHRRVMLTALVLGIAAFFPLLGRLLTLMVGQYEQYGALALRNQSRSTAVTADRGTIYDRNLNVLAISENRENVYLNPHELRQSGADVPGLSACLGKILQKDAAWIEAQAGDLKKRYKQVGTNISEEEAAQIRAYLDAQGISGVHLEPTSVRVYPGGNLAAQVIGFTNASNDGTEGIEAAYDRYLSGKLGKVVTTKGNNEMDMPFSYERFQAAQRGADVILTLDSTVQEILEKQLQASVDRYDVQNGAFGLVMNCKTGEILAMATLGSYDPNRYLEIADEKVLLRLRQMLADGTDADAYAKALADARWKQWRNRVLSDGYEPGSTFKVLTMAAALDCGAITLNTPFYCRGAEQIPGRSQLLHCWRSAGHGAEQTPQALQNSCNIAFAHIALKLGGERFYDYITRFGILEKTGIDLSGESKGVFFDKKLITNTEKWGTASLTSGSFGQTFKITPLQLVRAIASVVNGGKLMEPYIVSQVVDANGVTLLQQEPTVVRTTVSKETSDTMRALIRSVVTEGTAKNAAVAGFSIGGKTGTSEKIDVFDANGQRVQDKIVSFVGIAPMDDPEYIVLAALDTPSRATGIYISGGVMAAPTVGAVMADILPYLGVQRQMEGEPFSLENVTGKPIREAAALLREQKVTAVTVGEGETVTGQLPAAGQTLYPGGEVLLYLDGGTPESTVKVPDFRGMNRQQASDEAGKRGLFIRAIGNTDVAPNVTVCGQSEAPNTELAVGSTITLQFADGTLRD